MHNVLRFHVNVLLPTQCHYHNKGSCIFVPYSVEQLVRKWAWLNWSFCLPKIKRSSNISFPLLFLVLYKHCKRIYVNYILDYVKWYITLKDDNSTLILISNFCFSGQLISVSWVYTTMAFVLHCIFLMWHSHLYLFICHLRHYFHP